MKNLACLAAAVLLLTAGAWAMGEGGVSRELEEAAPEGAAAFLEGDYSPGGLSRGLGRMVQWAEGNMGAVFRQRLRGAASVLFVAALCGAVRSLGQGENLAVTLAGALAVTGLTAGSFDQLIGLGWETIGELHDFSAVLLPVLAAASAASGAAATAAFQHAAAVFFAQALITLMDDLLMPLTYLYIGVLTAACALGGGRLDPLAAELKRAVSALLTTSLLAFTLYLSVFRVVTGPADAAAVRTAKAALSGVVPVVGGILAEASEAVLAGAGALRGAVGVFGMLAVLGACAWPFLHLGVQYLLYKGAAVLAALVGMPELGKLLDGLGSAFALVLGMTGSCAVLILVSILCFVSAAVP